MYYMNLYLSDILNMARRTKPPIVYRYDEIQNLKRVIDGDVRNLSSCISRNRSLDI